MYFTAILKACEMPQSKLRKGSLVGQRLSFPSFKRKDNSEYAYFYLVFVFIETKQEQTYLMEYLTFQFSPIVAVCLQTQDEYMYHGLFYVEANPAFYWSLLSFLQPSISTDICIYVVHLTVAGIDLITLIILLLSL